MEFNPIQTNALPTKVKFLNLIWCIFNRTIFRIIPPYTSFFKKFKVLILRLFGAKVAWTANIHSSAKIEYPWNLSMGHLSSLGENCWVYAMNKISIGSKTCIDKNVFLITGSHDISSSTFDLITKPINIGDNVWITTGCYILPGISIGNFSVVATNSVVVTNINDNSVVGGNPAKFIKKREIVC